ncbi:SDR family NAD(P)-dependent oxidoreductase [Paenibacillus apiarius]|uniref:SDR family NAD(P)-dependent oxidoreductase n=1 Tax=Paenibacillus apiarius TaxID=46240 RepID=UPI00197FDF1D|nr:SDR family NAD(P)-dependent oxidoreductase [Paenibacillus apiarius]MBN3526391.1 SDR family NAD(P)-dependent oxidoreductase [Paenibacillus apiarius]
MIKKSKKKTSASKNKEIDIAIIGIACSFPGAMNYNEYWENLKEGRSSIQEIPADRWDWREYHEMPEFERNISVSRWGGFIKAIDAFDARFFGLSNREVDAMDPQQRIMLELSWSCFEDAGICPSTITGKNIGVFISAFNFDFKELVEKNQEAVEAHHSTGTSSALIPNRISYFFNIKGPSLQIDTSCSGSLTAIHTACRSIMSGDCEMALAGGISMLLSPTRQISFSQMGMLSPSGSVKTFDKSADGYVRGEGAGVILLKSLDKALADGDPIHGVIKGSAINHGGKTYTVTYPNPDAQADVIIEAIKRTGIPPESINYIEAHGTGTPKGDPIEFQGLLKAFGALCPDDELNQPKKNYCGLGSAKTNIGHLESAAGIAGVIKVLLSMKHGQLPGLLNFNQLNPAISIDETPFYIVDQTQEWVRVKDGEADIPRRAGVSSFGFGGTNGHVILEEAPAIPNSSEHSNFCHLICLSAKTNESLRLKVIDLENWLERNKQETNLADISTTLLLGRDHFPSRIAFVTDSVTDLKDKLTEILSDKENKECISRSDAATHTENLAPSLSLQQIDKLVETISASKGFRDIEYRKQLLILAECYINGYDFDWKKVFPSLGKRMNLPTYPFIGERFKIPRTRNLLKREKDLDLVIHPLLHQNKSTLLRQFYRSTFTGEEFFLKDHVINEGHVLPSAVYLEMARAALAHAGNGLAEETNRIRLQNVVWNLPASVGLESMELQISVWPEEDGSISFEIYSDIEKNGQERLVYSQGSGIFVPADETVILDLETTKTRCNLNYLTSDEYYNRLQAVGISNGFGFKSLQEMYVGQNCVLARLELPDCVSDDLDSFVLHPSLLESALQSVNGLMVREEKGEDQIAIQRTVAVAFDELEIIAACSKKMWSHVSLSAENSKAALAQDVTQRVDIVLCDETGKVCIRLKTYSYQVPGLNSSEETAENMMMVPAWNPVRMEMNGTYSSPDKNKLIVGGTKEIRAEFLRGNSNARMWDCEDKESSIEEIAEKLESYGAIDHVVWITPTHEVKSVVDEGILKAQASGVFFLFQMIKSLLKLGYSDKELELTIITINSQVVFQNERINPVHAGIHGLVGTMAKEFPQWGVRLFDMGSESNWPVTEMLSIPADAEGNALAHRNGSWYSLQLMPCRMGKFPVDSGETIYRESGTYVVIGGAGGLGEIWSEYMVRTYKANIIWIGRRQKNKEIEGKIKRLSAVGPAPHYISADATDLESLEKAYVEIKRIYPSVNGIIHSAVGLLDQSLSAVDEDLYKAIVGVKVNASVFMAKVFEKESLDFVVFFSSIASFQKLAGQSGYATGCTFKDAYAQRLSKEWLSKVKTINWGFWGGVGIGEVMPESSKIMLSLLGVDSIEPDKAMEAMELIMRTSTCQIVYMKTANSIEDKVSENKMECKPKVQKIQYKDMQENLDAARVESLLREKSTAYMKQLVGKALKIHYQKLDSSAPLEQYGIDSILITHLTDALRKVFHNISSTLFFECHTIDDLVEYFIQNQSNKLTELFGLTGENSEKLEEQQTRKEIISEKVTLPFLLKRAGKQFNDSNPFCQMSRVNLVETVDSANMPIAIIGMSGRFPQANNLDEYWDNLKSGRDCITEIPQERWALDGFYVNDVRKALEQKKSYSKWGGFIDGFADFDPRFFRISPHEAMNMDPQERLFLQECWRTFEDAGYTKEKIALRHKGKVGVFAGITRTGFEWYGPDLWKQGEDIRPNTSFSSIANRISYILDLHGPSLPIDTMCSSSLSAVHEACKHLRWGECEMAIAGGVNVYTHPSTYAYLCEMRMLSQSGKCKSFGKDADGFVPGEGVGAILLKPLFQAIEDRDHIYGVIRSTNINHGGKTNGYTVPNPNAQRDLIRHALDRAGVDARTISYVEAHGTGTELGDPIEITGLTQAFRSDTTDSQFCAIGSAKSNIGHLEGAAGIAGLMKIILQMKSGLLAPSLHAAELNPHIDFANSPFYVQRELAAWKRPVIEHNGIKREYPRMAGVSSFGAGGANAHVILEEYLSENERTQQTRSGQIGRDI